MMIGESTMRDPRMKARRLAFGVGLCAVAIAAGLQVQPASAQDAAATAALSSAKPQATSSAVYYVDFRARNAATYNCVAFIQDIARYMGLRVPGNHLLYPEDWVNNLKQLNGGRRYMSSPAVAQGPSGKPSASAQKPAAPAYASATATSY